MKALETNYKLLTIEKHRTVIRLKNLQIRKFNLIGIPVMGLIYFYILDKQ